MTGNLDQNLPPPQSAFVDPKTGILSNDGYQFLMNFINQVTQAVTTETVAAAVLAAGNTQATATALQSQWNAVTGQQGTGTGVLLQAYQQGQSQVVINEAGGIINVYPPPGAAIDGGFANVPVQMNQGTIKLFRFFTATDIRTS